MRRSILLAAGLTGALALAACGNSGAPAPTASPTASPTATAAPTPATVTVPDVRGDTEQEALVTFGATGLTAGAKTNRYDANAPKGTVLSTDPKAGVVVARGTAVDYLVSRGPAPTPSPSPKPTPKPTAKPTATPTAKPTPTPTAKPTPAPVALPGTSWTLKSFVDQDSTTIPVADGVTITASFSATDISGSSGCNTYSGPYTLGSGGAITFGTLIVTGKACAEAVMAEESAYLTALQQTGSFSATTAKLKLVASSSSARLVYSPGSP